MNFKKLIKSPTTYILIARKRFINYIRAFFYRGKNVVCEICGWNGQRFFNDTCPKCNSLPRTRLLPFALRYFKLDQYNPKILHIAPNKNEFNYIRKHVTPLNYYDRLNIRAVHHINLVQDLTQTNLDNSVYNLCIAWHVLEHIPEDIKAIKEVYRLLKPGGSFLVSVPIYPIGNQITFEDTKIPYKDFEKTHGHYDHCRSCGIDYYKRFELVGFKTQTLLVKDVETKTINYYGLRNDHVVWCFTK